MVNLNSSSLLITSGMHGDEFQVVDIVSDFLAQHKSLFHKLLHIPLASPSALKLKTRINKHGNDLNRCFTKETNDPEALTLIKRINNKHFTLAMDFHEDPGINKFYLYDSGKIDERQLGQFRKGLTDCGIPLFNGVDDPDDPILNHKINDGYVSFAGVGLNSMTGTFWDYTLTNKIVERMVVLEIPGQETLSIKKKIVELIFNNFEIFLPKTV